MAATESASAGPPADGTPTSLVQAKADGRHEGALLKRGPMSLTGRWKKVYAVLSSDKLWLFNKDAQDSDLSLDCLDLNEASVTVSEQSAPVVESAKCRTHQCGTSIHALTMQLLHKEFQGISLCIGLHTRDGV